MSLTPNQRAQLIAINTALVEITEKCYGQADHTDSVVLADYIRNVAKQALTALDKLVAELVKEV